MPASVTTCTVAVWLGELRQTEVEDFDVTVFGKKNVFRLQVAMNDATVMSRGQSARDLQRVLDCFPGW